MQLTVTSVFNCVSGWAGGVGFEVKLGRRVDGTADIEADTGDGLYELAAAGVDTGGCCFLISASYIS